MNNPSLPVLAGPAAVLLLAKVTILLSLAGLSITLLRRRSAATRHVVWLTALVGALALAPLATLVPKLPLPLPAEAGRAVPQLVFAEPSPAPAGTRKPQPRSPTYTSSSRVTSAASTTRPRRTLPPPAAVLTLVWLAGFAGVALWSAFGHLGLWGLNRSSIPVERQAWTRLYGLEPPRAGSAGRVRLGLSSVVGTPLTWGWLRPIVLLPSRSSAWPLERRRAALLHELAHVGRADYVAQLVAMLACAAYWFHPLVWWAAAKLRSESEHACDDRVLGAGTPAPSYATDLLAVAHGARDPGGSLVAIGMARRSHLEGRLLAVLDESRPRGTVGARAWLATLAATLLLLVPFAGLEPRLHAAPGAAVEPELTNTTMVSTSAATITVAAEKPSKRESKEAAMADEEGDRPQIEDTMRAAPGGRLELDLQSGASVTIRGWDRHEVSVRGTLGGSDWRDTEVAIGPESFGVGIRARQIAHSSNSSTSHRFEIRVPARYDVHLSSAGGSLTIVDVEGTFAGNTGGGELVLRRARGRARLNTGGGDIEVSDSDLSGSVSTGGGVVKLSNVKGGLRGSSGSGPVIYSDADPSGDDTATGDLTNVLPDGTSGRIQVGTKAVGYLHIDRAGGTIDLTDVPKGGEIQTGGGEIRIRGGAGKIHATTGGGDIAIGPIAGSVKASTGAGDVRIQLASIGGKEQSVEVWSGSGNVIIELPGDLNARIDVETAYTDSYGRAAKITSAWALDREPDSDWDASMGTPRRHVRASGIAGRGQGRIRVNTVNGNIELRRVGAGTTKSQ